MSKAKLIHFFAAGLENTNGVPLSGYKVRTYESDGSTAKVVWEDRDKSLPTSAGKSSFTLDTTGRASVYGDGILTVKIWTDTADPDTDSPYKEYTGIELRSTTAFTDIALGLSAIQAIDGTADEYIYLSYRSSPGDGGHGYFRWDSSNLSTEVAANEVTTGEGDGGIYVAPNSDKTGASGAWVRQYTGFALLEWWGLNQDDIGTISTTDLSNILSAAKIGGVPARFESTQNDLTIAVGTDTATIQDALDLAPLYVRHAWEITVPDGTYNEDLVIPHFSTIVENKLNNTIPHAGKFNMTGNITTPSSVKVDSMYFAGGHDAERITVDGFEIIDVGPAVDGSNKGAMEIRNGCQVTLQAVNFNNGTGSPLSRAVSVYGGHLITKGPIDVGTDLYDTAITVKDGGIYTDECVANDFTGSTRSQSFNNQNGQMYVDRRHSITNSASQPNHQLYKSARTPIFSFDSSEAGEGYIQFQGQTSFKNLPQLSGNVGGGSAIAISDATTVTIQRVRYEIPAGKVLILRWINHIVANANLDLIVSSDDGSYTSASFADQAEPETVLYDNSIGVSTAEANVDVEISNTSGGASNIQPETGWSMQLAIE